MVVVFLSTLEYVPYYWVLAQCTLSDCSDDIRKHHCEPARSDPNALPQRAFERRGKECAHPRRWVQMRKRTQRVVAHSLVVVEESGIRNPRSLAAARAARDE